MKMYIIHQVITLLSFIRLTYAGGIHRLAQSQWNFPNKGRNTELYLYFSLDNDLPADGYLKMTFPADFTHVPTQCDVWVLGTDLSYQTDANKRYHGTITGSNSVFYCQFTVKKKRYFVSRCLFGKLLFQNIGEKRNLRFLEGFILCSVAVSLAPPLGLEPRTL